MSKSAKIEHFHSWHDNHERGVYLYRSYKMCYITICRFMPGERDPSTNEIHTKVAFIPTVNGLRLHNRGNGVYTDTPYSFDTLEQAKNGAMRQIDIDREMNKDVRYVRIKKDQSDQMSVSLGPISST